MKCIRLNRDDISELNRIRQSIEDKGEINFGFFWPQEHFISEVWQTSGFGISIPQKNSQVSQFDGHKIVAFALYRELPIAWEISVLATDPEYRRQGYMTKLLQFMIREKPMDIALWLEVHEQNHSAISLYEKLGFAASSYRPNYYKDGLAAILMTHP